MTHTLEKHVRDNFDGMLVIADIHGDFESYGRATAFADAAGLFVLSLGDLVDRGPSPFEVVSDMHARMKAGRAGFCVGNHDDKFRRLHHGAKVSLSLDARRTLESVGEERREHFLTMYTEVVEMSVMSGLFHTFGDYTFVHAASHPAMWEGVTELGKSARSRALVGETNGETYADGYPVRLYNWVDEIPMGKTVMVGHDKMAVFNVPLMAPLTKSSPNGGKAIFMDTGCGKGGFLTGAVFMKHKGKFRLETFKEFK